MYVHIFYPHKTFQRALLDVHMQWLNPRFFFVFFSHDSVRLTESTVLTQLISKSTTNPVTTFFLWRLVCAETQHF